MKGAVRTMTPAEEATWADWLKTLLPSHRILEGLAFNEMRTAVQVQAHVDLRSVGDVRWRLVDQVAKGRARRMRVDGAYRYWRMP